MNASITIKVEAGSEVVLLQGLDLRIIDSEWDLDKGILHINEAQVVDLADVFVVAKSVTFSIPRGVRVIPPDGHHLVERVGIVEVDFRGKTVSWKEEDR